MALIKLFLQFASVVGGIAATSAVIVSVTNTSSEIKETQNNFDNKYHYFHSPLLTVISDAEHSVPPEPLENGNETESKPKQPKIAVGNYKCVIPKLQTQQAPELTDVTVFDCEFFYASREEPSNLKYLKIDTDFLKSKESKIQQNTEINPLKHYIFKIPKSINLDMSKNKNIYLFSKEDSKKPFAMLYSKDENEIIWENGKIKTNKYLTKPINIEENAEPSKFTCNLTTNNIDNCHFYHNSAINSNQNITFNMLEQITKTSISNLINPVLETNKILFVDLINHTKTLNKGDYITISNSGNNQTKTLEVVMPILAINNNDALSQVIVIE